jgi:Tfp pilus assembly protein PilN
MRPVNLIPPDERRGDSAPLRTGNMIYVLVAGLALLLLGIVAVTLTSKQIEDRKSEKVSLQQELDQETARANSLAAFTSFRQVQETRTATMTSLAESRFDWTRVLNELSLVLPGNVSLVLLTGTAAPDVQVQDSEQIPMRTTVSGPALEITGCAPGQTVVAKFVASLEDIDGVTRVGLDSSEVPNSEGESSSSGGSDGSGETSGCPSQRIYKFKIVVAFDKVPTPPTATSAPSVPAAVSSGSAPQATSAPTSSQGG